MFALGYIHFKKYTVWINPPVFTLNSYQQGADKLQYYEVLLTKKQMPEPDSTTLKEKELYNFTVNIATSPDFKFLMNLNEKNQPIDGETDMIQYQSYIDRGSNLNSLYKLSKKNVEILLEKCAELSV